MAAHLATVVLVPAHGILNIPPSRNSVDADDPRWAGGNFPKNDGSPGCTEDVSWDGFCGCFGSNGTNAFAPGQSCLWFSQGCSVGCDACDPDAQGPWNYNVCGSDAPPTVCKPEHRTTNRFAPCGSALDWTRHNPWRSPGSAPVYDACGKAGGQDQYQPYAGATYYIPTEHAKVGDLGSKVLPPRPSGTVWVRGSVVQTSWTINANHGGGYAFRLCSRAEPLTEECFQRTPLRFAGVQSLQFKHNRTVFDIPPTYVSEGTSPPGSTWAKNPLPIDPTDFAPPCDADHDPFYPRPVPYSRVEPTRCWGNFPSHTAIIDHLHVPAHLPPGEYVLGWRWDGEQSAQTWAACADVTIVDGSGQAVHVPAEGQPAVLEAADGDRQAEGGPAEGGPADGDQPADGGPAEGQTQRTSRARAGAEGARSGREGRPRLADGQVAADMHLPLLGEAVSAALRANAFISARVPNEIDFATEDVPHVTLYLTSWQATEPVSSALTALLPRLSAQLCTLTLSAPYAAGQYAMLNVSLTPCLQRASDVVVNATHAWAVPNQSVPAWVDSLPEPARSEKIRYVREYGSPNVFGQFDPHVTIGWASNASAVAAAVAELAFGPVSFTASELAFGLSGPHGTVLQGRDFVKLNLTEAN